MSRMRALILGVAVVSAGVPAIACYDHEQSGSYESDGPTDYRDLAGMASSVEPAASRPVALDLGLALGAVVSAGSIGLFAWRTKPRV